MATDFIFFNDLKDTTVYRTDQARARGGVADREKTGTIEDVVLDLQSGRVVLFEMGSGGFLGMGQDTFALPAQALSFRGEGAVLQVEEGQLYQAPAAANKETGLYDATYINDVHRHYGYNPLS